MIRTIEPVITVVVVVSSHNSYLLSFQGMREKLSDSSLQIFALRNLVFCPKLFPEGRKNYYIVHSPLVTVSYVLSGTMVSSCSRCVQEMVMFQYVDCYG